MPDGVTASVAMRSFACARAAMQLAGLKLLCANSGAADRPATFDTAMAIRPLHMGSTSRYSGVSSPALWS